MKTELSFFFPVFTCSLLKKSLTNSYSNENVGCSPAPTNPTQYPLFPLDQVCSQLSELCPGAPANPCPHLSIIWTTSLQRCSTQTMCPTPRGRVQVTSLLEIPTDLGGTQMGTFSINDYSMQVPGGSGPTLSSYGSAGLQGAQEMASLSLPGGADLLPTPVSCHTGL